MHIGLQNILQGLGLTEKQAKVYLAALALGKAPAQNIAQKAQLKRPTTYVILKELKELKLVQELKTKTTTLFSVVSPQELVASYQKKFTDLKNHLPELLAIKAASAEADRPNIEIYEGKAGFEKVYADFVNQLDKNKTQEILIFSSLSHIQKDFAHLLEKWHKALQRQQPSIRELITKSKLSEAYKKEIDKLGNPNHQIKFLDEALAQPKTELILYSNILLVVQLNQESWVLKIKSPLLADSYRALFEAAWQNL